MSPMQTFEEWLETVEKVTGVEIDLHDKGALEMAQKVLDWRVREFLAYTFLGNVGRASYTFAGDTYTVTLTAEYEAEIGSDASASERAVE